MKIRTFASRRRTTLAALGGLALLLAASPAWAAPAPDLQITYQPPATTAVYASGSYGVTVANVGQRDAAGVQLTIQLPATATSPQTYVMGTLGAFDPRCALGGPPGTAAGTKLVCSLGTVRKNRSTVVTFAIALPEKTGPLLFSSTATTTTSVENNPGNNTNVAHTATLSYVANTIAVDAQQQTLAYTNKHCTGTSLTAYFECTRFPSSISSHATTFSFDGTLSIVGEPGYTGYWSQNGVSLTLDYVEISSGQVVSEFSGRGVPGTGCFEGLTRFPDGMGGYSPYVSPYRVCPQ